MVVHIPFFKKVATPFDTVQTVVVLELYDTGRPELAVAVRVSGVPTS
jgi:hypothetical protein